MTYDASPSGPKSGADADLLRGTPYRMLEVLGSGGMGEVVLAEHRRLGKLVVAKLVHPQLSNAHAADRLRVEAQILSRLSHPNLVEVTDLGITEDGRPFLVMERLVGRTLVAEVHERGALPVEEAVQIAIDVLSALEAAHAVGIVHRDVKTENIFLHEPTDRSGAKRRVVKLLDFGIAKILAGDAVEPTRFPTEEGTLLGTPRFCSPEQAMGRPDVDHRADLYSVGVVLFFMVTGRRPFEQQGLVELVKAHVFDAPPRPSDRAPHPIPPALEAVILRALAKQPGDRYPDAAAMTKALQLALQAARAPSPTGTPGPAPAPRRPAPATERLDLSTAPRPSPAMSGTLPLDAPRPPQAFSPSPQPFSAVSSQPRSSTPQLAAAPAPHASAPPAIAPPAIAPPAIAPPAVLPPALAPVPAPADRVDWLRFAVIFFVATVVLGAAGVLLARFILAR
jgi:eukaryotic-like serine/threonine-protein kinase